LPTPVAPPKPDTESRSADLSAMSRWSVVAPRSDAIFAFSAVFNDRARLAWAHAAWEPTIMQPHRSFIQRTLGRARCTIVRLACRPSSRGRWLPAPTSVLSLLLSTVGPPVIARAQTPPDPSARIGFVIDSLYVIDDEDLFGNGELRFSAVLCDITNQTEC